MNYAAIKTHDVANGPGVRVSLFVSGCRNRCPGCFNEETWDFDYGQPYTKETVKYLLELLDHEYIQGLTILGGDPCEPENIHEVNRLIFAVRHFFPEKDIWVYTGYTIEELQHRGEVYTSLLGMIDVLVDGRFVESKKDISLRFRGSKNQRILKRLPGGEFKNIAD